MKQLTDTERLEVAINLLDERQVNEYASQCSELEQNCKMAKYCVQRIEVYRQDVLLEADSASQAIRLVAEGEGDEAEMYYSRTLDPDEWLAFEIK